MSRQRGRLARAASAIAWDREFQPLSLQVYFNGQLDVSGSYIKKNVGKAEWSCNGQTTVPTPDGPAVIAFTALGNFHP